MQIVADRRCDDGGGRCGDGGRGCGDGGRGMVMEVEYVMMGGRVW